MALQKLQGYKVAGLKGGKSKGGIAGMPSLGIQTDAFGTHTASCVGYQLTTPEHFD